jgi:hypothetical protein
MARGRWAASASARRYIQSGVAMLMNQSAPEHITAAGVILTKDIVNSRNTSE